MSDKPRVSYSDLAWATAFARIHENDMFLKDGVLYRVTWKHEDPPWIRLTYRTEKRIAHRMVRPGNSLLLELRPQ